MSNVEGLAAFQGQVEALLETLRETSVLVDDFRPENQPRILSQLNEAVSQMDRVAHSASEAGSDVLMPKTLFNYIDNGRNPDIFTKELIASSVRESEVCKGKLVALDDYLEQLAAKALAEFPELEPHLKRLKKHPDNE